MHGPTISQIRLAISAAAVYRRERHMPTHGLIITQHGKPHAWTNTLANPESWEPGCIAVTATGTAYIATGGDTYNGANSWEPITSALKTTLSDLPENSTAGLNALLNAGVTTQEQSSPNTFDAQRFEVTQ